MWLSAAADRWSPVPHSQPVTGAGRDRTQSGDEESQCVRRSGSVRRQGEDEAVRRRRRGERGDAEQEENREKEQASAEWQPLCRRSRTRGTASRSLT